jgi:hypothetical protein
MLQLAVPRTDTALQQRVETRPKALAEWLRHLPFASPVDAAQQVLTALAGLNRHPLDAEERLALLALYRPAVARTVVGLEAGLLDAGVPPFSAQRQAGVVLRELRAEHAIGYKQALVALAGGRGGRTASRRVAEAATRLAGALGEQLVACGLTYYPAPPGLWRELHQLHRFAADAGFASTPLDDAPALDLAYRQALLFALADPHRMSPAESVHTRLFLAQHGALAHLGPRPQDARRGFGVQQDGDAAPSHLASEPPQTGLWLDTDALCRQLRDCAIRLRTGDTPQRIGLPVGMDSTLSFNLFRRLLKLWGAGARRAFRRYAAAGSTLSLVAGVSAIHRLLEQHAPPDADDIETLSVGDAGALAGRTVEISASTWTVVNDSAAGMALAGAPERPLNLKVGDPLALHDEAAGGPALGVIRWLRARDARRVELGIERLAPHVQPVSVRPLRGVRRGKPAAALFLPGIASLQVGDRLLLPRALYEAGMDAEVLHGPRHTALTFGRCLEHTPAFDLIEFTLFADHAP